MIPPRINNADPSNFPTRTTTLLMERLGERGLLDARILPDGDLLVRVDAALPYVRPRGEEKMALWADVRINRMGDALKYHIEHPYSGDVLHPNWDGDGYWRLKHAEQFAYAGVDSLVEIIEYMIGSLKLRSGYYTLREPINRNAVIWCYKHGKIPISLVRRNGSETQHSEALARRSGERPATLQLRHFDE